MEKKQESRNSGRMDRMDVADDRMADACNARHEKLNERLGEGAKTMVRHEVEISTLKEDVREVKSKVDGLQSVGNRILAGIVVACILLVINMAIGL